MPPPSMPRILDPTALRVVWTILVVGGALALVYLLRTVLLVLAFSVVFAYLIFPLVKLVERGLPRSTRRPLAIGVVYLVLVAALSTLIALVGPPLGRELAALGQKFPEMSDQIRSGRVISNIFPRWGGAEILDDLVRAHLPHVVGPLAAGVTVVSVALFSGFGHPWLLALFILIWRLVQDYLSSPLIMGRGVELHPGLVIFGVLAGGELAGVAGMFLSVPVIAGLKVVWRRLREFRADA